MNLFHHNTDSFYINVCACIIEVIVEVEVFKDALEWRHNGRDSASNHQPHVIMAQIPYNDQITTFTHKTTGQQTVAVRTVHDPNLCIDCLCWSWF